MKAAHEAISGIQSHTAAVLTFYTVEKANLMGEISSIASSPVAQQVQMEDSIRSKRGSQCSPQSGMYNMLEVTVDDRPFR